MGLPKPEAEVWLVDQGAVVLTTSTTAIDSNEIPSEDSCVDSQSSWDLFAVPWSHPSSREATSSYGRDLNTIITGIPSSTPQHASHEPALTSECLSSRCLVRRGLYVAGRRCHSPPRDMTDTMLGIQIYHKCRNIGWR